MGEIRGHGRRAMGVKADVADAGAVGAMFDRIEHEWGAVDILVNNAGIDGKRGLAWEIDLDAWRRVVEVNLLGAFYCARRALGPMVQRRDGVVLNISSVHEVIPWTGYSAYAAAKAWLGMLAKTLAQEAARYGVRVLSLAPGAIKTKINAHVWKDEQAYHDLMANIPANRLGEVDEIARIALMLCSDEARYLLGTTVYVDGGMVLYPSFESGG